MTDVAKAVGVHKATVSRQARAWGIVGADGLVDLDEYKSLRATGVDPALQTTGKAIAAVLPVEDAPGLAADRARKMAADASMAELQLARQRGELVELQAVTARTEDYARQLRDRVLMVPRDIAGDCARLGDEGAIEARISLALRAVLDGLHADLTASPDAVRGAA